MLNKFPRRQQLSFSENESENVELLPASIDEFHLVTFFLQVPGTK